MMSVPLWHGKQVVLLCILPLSMLHVYFGEIASVWSFVVFSLITVTTNKLKASWDGF